MKILVWRQQKCASEKYISRFNGEHYPNQLGKGEEFIIRCCCNSLLFSSNRDVCLMKNPIKIKSMTKNQWIYYVQCALPKYVIFMWVSLMTGFFSSKKKKSSFIHSFSFYSCWNCWAKRWIEKLFCQCCDCKFIEK